MRKKIRKFKSTLKKAGVIMKTVQAKITDVLRLIHVNMANHALSRCCNIKQPMVISLS